MEGPLIIDPARSLDAVRDAFAKTFQTPLRESDLWARSPVTPKSTSASEREGSSGSSLIGSELVAQCAQ